MKQVAISKATPLQLDWMVGHFEGAQMMPVLSDDGFIVAMDKNHDLHPFSPTTDHGIAMQIIERDKIAIFPNDDEWTAAIKKLPEIFMCDGPNPLIAAMRVYVLKSAREVFVEIPDFF